MAIKQLLIIFVLLLVPSWGFADVIPSSRIVTWQGNVGVSGGIPARATICSTLSASGGDDTAAINNAITACTAGQTVKLNAGTYHINSSINMKSNVTLRGSGVATTTIITTYTGVGGSISFIGTYTFGTAFNLTATGLSKASTQINTSSAHGWSSGDLITVDQLTQPAGDPPVSVHGNQWCGGQGNNDVCGRTCANTGNTESTCRPWGQVVRLTSGTSGTVANLEIPLYYDYSTGLTAQGAKLTAVVANAGVEDLTLQGTTSTPFLVRMLWTDSCWVSNVELNGFANNCVASEWGYRNEFRKMKIHGGLAGGSYGISFMGGGSANLVEDNIFYDAECGPILIGANSGHVFGYNYIYKTCTSCASYIGFGIASHGAHPMMNLFEGNYLDGDFFGADNDWGSSSHGTIFRNKTTHYNTATASIVNQRSSIGLANNNWYYNVVGNVLGTMGQATNYQRNTVDYNTGSTIYVVDYQGAVYSGNTGTSTHLLRHANWDANTGAIVYCVEGNDLYDCEGGDGSYTLANSYYLTAKPTWMCDQTTWPPVNPATPSVSDIPAKIRYDSGTCTFIGVPAAPANVLLRNE